MDTAFAEGRSYVVEAPEPGSEEDSEEAKSIRGAFGLRLHLLGLMGRAAKPTLDLTLSAYYTEAWTLLRTMLDGWARCIYVRLHYEEHVRWHEPKEGIPFKGPPDWGQINGVIRSRGSADDKALFAAAELRWEMLHIGAHPSSEGIGQVRNDELNIMMYRPEYHRDFCMHTFSLGVFVMKTLLSEVALLGGHEAWWLRSNAKWSHDIESLEKSIQPGLDEMAKQLKARRGRAKAKRLKEKEEKWQVVETLNALFVSLLLGPSNTSLPSGKSSE